MKFLNNNNNNNNSTQNKSIVLHVSLYADYSCVCVCVWVYLKVRLILLCAAAAAAYEYSQKSTTLKANKLQVWCEEHNNQMNKLQIFLGNHWKMGILNHEGRKKNLNINKCTHIQSCVFCTRKLIHSFI